MNISTLIMHKTRNKTHKITHEEINIHGYKYKHKEEASDSKIAKKEARGLHTSVPGTGLCSPRPATKVTLYTKLAI